MGWDVEIRRAKYQTLYYPYVISTTHGVGSKYGVGANDE